MSNDDQAAASVPDPRFDPIALAEAISSLNEFASQHAPEQRSPLVVEIEAHLGTDAATLPVVADQYPLVQRPNLQLALDAWMARAGRSHRLIGLAVPNHSPMEISLAEVVTGSSWGPRLKAGPTTYVEEAVGPEATLACLTNALLLLTEGDDAFVALVGMTPDMGMRLGELQLQVIASDGARATAFLAEIRALVADRNVYRGQVISLSSPDRFNGNTAARFHERPDVARSQLILADGVLERIERQVIGVAEHADSLRAAGRDLKRGLLLFGPPGTGKTLTVQYLTSRQADRTVLLVGGADVQALAMACRLARSLAPATVVLEDVDLVAEERTMFGHGQHPMTAALLNEMDAVDGASDVVFVLTTNRADLLEPALAARPGRVDQAIEIALPDADCRARLVELYAGDIALTDAQRAGLVERLDGVSAAFVKELMRRASVRAALDGRTAAHDDVIAALDELYADTSALTRTLLGANPTTSDGDDENGGVTVVGPFAAMSPALTVPREIRQMIRGTS